jgi:riboflavin biosynthesis pyrimidine reductase
MERLETLFDAGARPGLPLPSELAALYGSLGFPSHPGRQYVISNFVSTLDGVVSLDAPGKAVGDVISGSNEPDSMVMGLLRAAADCVVIGAGTLRASPHHLWNPQHVFPPFADAYKVLRERLGKQPSPLNVIVTARGTIDLSLPLFQSGKVPVLIVTTRGGARRFNETELPESVHVVEGSDAASLGARDILRAITAFRPSSDTVLIEGGPHLLGHFIAERCLDELFLTLAPQLAGRESALERLGVVAGQIFAPEHPVWGTLVSVKRGGSHLFLRYAFESDQSPKGLSQ